MQYVYLNIANLQIKRETVCDHGGHVNRWWFVIHAPENVLIDLKAAWEQLQLQAGWKLEPCFKTSQHASSTTSSPPANFQSHIGTPCTASASSEESLATHVSNSQVSDNQAAVLTPPAVSPFLGK